MEPWIEIEQILEEEHFASIESLDTFLFDKFTDNTTKNVEMEAHFVGEREKPSSSSVVICPLCGSEPTKKSCLDEMLDGVVQIEDFKETINNVKGSSSSTGRTVGSTMDHCGNVGVSNKGNATRVAGNAKTWTRRTRYKKGSPEAARHQELYKIRKREAAARSFAQKQAYTRNLELEVLSLRKEYTFRRNLFKFTEGYPVSTTARRQLRRTKSAPVWFSRGIDFVFYPPATPMDDG